MYILLHINYEFRKNAKLENVIIFFASFQNLIDFLFPIISFYISSFYKVLFILFCYFFFFFTLITFNLVIFFVQLFGDNDRDMPTQ